MATLPFKFKVEFEPGQKQKVEVTTRSTNQWDDLGENKDLIRRLEGLFAYDCQVQDELVGTYRPDHRTMILQNQIGVEASERSLVILLESPHLHEFTAEGVPIGPLQNPASREKFMGHIACICAQLSPRQSVDVILCNPIRWQTSLVSLYPNYEKLRAETNEDKTMKETVRNNVWRAVWRHEQKKGKKVRKTAQDLFCQRLRQYNPSVVLNACTYDLQPEVGQVLAEISAKVGFAVFHTQHPSAWPEPLRIEDGASRKVSQ